MIAATYPSYKDLDEFIDVQALTALNGFITQKLRERLAAAEDRRFYTTPRGTTPQSGVLGQQPLGQGLQLTARQA